MAEQLDPLLVVGVVVAGLVCKALHRIVKVNLVTTVEMVMRNGRNAGAETACRWRRWTAHRRTHTRLW